MATGKRICKICGKEYRYCINSYSNKSVFRWQDVACCPEHGSQYLAQIEASREATASQTTPVTNSVEATDTQSLDEFFNYLNEDEDDEIKDGFDDIEDDFEEDNDDDE